VPQECFETIVRVQSHNISLCQADVVKTDSIVLDAMHSCKF